MPKENQNSLRNDSVLIMCFCNGRGNWLQWRKSNSELLQVKIILFIEIILVILVLYVIYWLILVYLHNMFP